MFGTLGNLLRKNFTIAVALAGLSSVPISARDPNWWPQRQGRTPRASGGVSESVPWPTTWAALQTGAVSSTIGSFGDFGFDADSRAGAYPWWPQLGFGSPPGSGIDYLYDGAIWVGGIVGTDTLVTTGSSLVYYNVHYVEFAPAGFAGTGLGSIRPCEGVADSSLRSECTDTIQPGLFYPDPRYSETHRPLHVSLVNRASVWSSSPADHCILFDVLITNIGNKVIRSGYVGLWLSPWIRGPASGFPSWQDDFTGSIPNRRIAYAIDNDGDPVRGRYVSDTCPTKAVAWKFHVSSFVPHNSTYAWALSYDTLASGPRLKNAPARSLAKDAGRYALMSSGEWDYDQVMINTIGPDDSVWEEPSSYEISQFALGSSIDVLTSLGPFDLLPDSSVRIVFSLFAADAVHQDPFIMDLLPIAPELYREDLNLESVVRESAIADSLASLISVPNAPVTGARVIDSTYDSVIVAWDPWVLTNTDGYNLYLTPIPDTAFPVPGVVPPWILPAQPQFYKSIGRGSRCTLSGLSPRRAYSFQIANRVGSNSGAISWPMSVKLNSAPAVPVVDDTLTFIRGDSLSISWTQPPGTPVDHYTVYKFADSASAKSRYLPFYSETPQPLAPKRTFVVDGKTYYFYALTRYRELGDLHMVFSDTAVDGEEYALTAVDSAGYESDFSHPILVLDARRSKDILVMTNSGITMFVSRDSLTSFYNSVLSGHTFDIYSFLDSTQGTRCPDFSPNCLKEADLMPYKMIIVDDGLADCVFSQRYDRGDGPFSRYLESGGTIAYFGSFKNMRYNPLQITSPPMECPAGSAFVSKYFGIDSLFYVGLTYYTRLASPYIDTLFGFSGATAVMEGAVSISVDTGRCPYDARLLLYWPATSPPSVSTFVPNARGHVTHRYASSSPKTSMNANQPVGISTRNGVWQTFLFGFHLWYMDPVEARHLVDWMFGSSPTPVRNSRTKGLPQSFALDQNYPNPFNPSTTIQYGLPERSKVTIEIFNVLGQKVRSLVNETRSAGSYKTVWDGRSDAGAELATGIYLCRMQSGSYVAVRKMILLR